MVDIMYLAAFMGAFMALLLVGDIIMDKLPERVTDKLFSLIGWN